jgi:hypothetical protein
MVGRSQSAVRDAYLALEGEALIGVCPHSSLKFEKLVRCIWNIGTRC